MKPDNEKEEEGEEPVETKIDWDTITSYSKTRCMTEIYELILVDLNIVQMEGLKELKNLRRLDLSFNKIKLIENIDDLRELRDLNVGHN
jgi:Leucine-rich repeat (LRR) protein